MTKSIFINGKTFMVELAEDDLARIKQDGFIPIRDDDGKLLFCFHPIFNEIQIKRRGKIITIPLAQFQESNFVIELNLGKQSATSAAQQGGNHGRRTNRRSH